MANRYILPVFKVVMEEPFIFSEPCRIGMQGIAYLLKVLGVPIGEYSFQWSSVGPYSSRLRDDMLFEELEDRSELIGRVELVFHHNCLVQITRIKKMVASFPSNSYTASQKLQCLASIHYLRAEVLPSQSSELSVLAALVERIPSLGDQDENVHAFRIIEELLPMELHWKTFPTKHSGSLSEQQGG